MLITKYRTSWLIEEASDKKSVLESEYFGSRGPWGRACRCAGGSDDPVGIELKDLSSLSCMGPDNPIDTHIASQVL